MSDNTEIEDISQEVMIAVYKSRHTYQPERPFEPWLFAIVRKVSWEHFRRERQRLGFQVLVDEMPEMCTEGRPSQDLEVREALEQLSPTQIEALGLTKLLGLSVEEAARRAGTSVGSMEGSSASSVRISKEGITPLSACHQDMRSTTKH